MKKTLARLGMMVVAVLALGSCYFPVYFDAEIELSRQGYYRMIFDGYLADISLYHELKEKKITPDEEKRKIKQIRTDFERDRSTKEFKYHKEGVFKVQWEKSGDLLKVKAVTFFRRNEPVLILRYSKEDRAVYLQTTPISKIQQEQLKKMGLGMEGEIRVKTDAKVLAHDASQVRKTDNPAERMYVWKIRDLADRAHMTVEMR
ncbi:MAG: hypothetical protein H7841_12365 [Magnetospirillum sp. WYHS-4]